MKKYFIAISIIAAAIQTACTKGGTNETLTGASYTVTSVLDGTKPVPATSKDTTKASLTGWYDEQANGFTFTVTYKKDTSVIKLDTLTTLQFFRNAPAAGSSPVRTLPVSAVINAASKTNISGSFNAGLAGYTGIAPEDVPSFVNNQWFIVLTSRKFPAGVAGGQILLSKN